jgi:hypothetical protein
MRQTKTETKSKGTVAGEELVEHCSMPAAVATESTGLVCGAAGKQPLKLVMALLLSAAAAWLGAVTVHVGYDWGYHLIASLYGQAAEANQGVMAFTSLLCSIIPMLFGLFLGYFKAAAGAKRGWILAGAAVVLLFLTLVVFSGSPPDFLIHPLRTAGQTVCGLGAYLGGLIGGQSVYRSLSERMRRPIVALLPAMAAFLPMAVACSLVAVDFRLELAAYSFLSLAAAAVSVRLSGAKRWSSVLSIALISILPLVLANMLNLFGNLLSLALDTVAMGAGLGWRALLSAVLISTVALGSALLGGIVGRRKVQDGQAHQV